MWAAIGCGRGRGSCVLHQANNHISISGQSGQACQQRAHLVDRCTGNVSTKHGVYLRNDGDPC